MVQIKPSALGFGQFDVDLDKIEITDSTPKIIDPMDIEKQIMSKLNDISASLCHLKPEQHGNIILKVLSTFKPIMP